MDVALDANEFLSDPRMESVRFQSLLNYLRKTESKLVIPKIVWDEVIARYPDIIAEPYKKAVNHVNSLRRLLLSAKVNLIPDLLLDREIKVLKQKLRKPSKHVRSRLLTNFSDVPVEEVARRGVARIPPANSKGEELRDVIIWLMMVAHAKKSQQGVAFISHDEHFREGDTLHPELSKDLDDGKVRLYFYRSIDDFIKAHAPSLRVLTEEEVFDLIARQTVLDLFELEARKLSPRHWGSSSVEITDRQISFLKGSLFNVGGGAEYGEIEFTGQLRSNITYSPMFTFATTDLSGFKLQSNEATTKVNMYPLPTEVRLNMNPTLGGISTEWQTLGPGIFNYAMPPAESEGQFSLRPVTQTDEVLISGKLAIVVRVLSSKITKLEVEGFEITERQELPKANITAGTCR